MIHQEIALKISEVQDGLSTLPTKNAFEGDQFKLIKSNQQKPGQGRPLDLLEIYCSPNSTITTFVNKRGGHAMRFTKEDGDLNSEEGVQKLWLWIYLYEPRHIWMAPECRLWGKFANLNMSKGLDVQQRIMKERRENKKHLVLCNEIFLHQIENRRHAHLEQPSESAMTKQKELYELEQGTLKAVFDMCRVGKLKVPGDNMYLQKRTTVHTSCGYLDHHLHQKFCQHDHEHRVIQGSIKVGKMRQNISAYAAAYTASFGSFVARVILEECRSPESPITMLLDPQFWDVHAVGDDDHDRPKTAHVDSQSQKRPRYGIKGPPRGPDIAQERTRYGRAPTWESFVKGVGSRVPRVGNFVLRAMDPGFEDVQLLVPEMHVKMVLICRGTERYRVPGSLASKEEVPWRKTVIVSREDGVVQDLGPPENWAALPRLQQTRKAGSARMSITVFGTLESQQTHVSFPRGQSQGTGSVVSSGIGAVVEIPKKGEHDMTFENKGQLGIISPMEVQNPERSEVEVEAWAPKIIPKSGPAFEALSNQQKNDLRRLHSNLGHPSPEKLCRVLTENGADAQVIAAARDYQCDVCVENKPGPTLPSPSTIHELREFNDCVGCDGVYWKSRAGVVYHFMHFIDEATLFHLGTPSGRTVEEQIKTLEDTWLHWAGPCKILYLDPAGGYVNDKWHEFLQKENIRVSMTAGDSHWQLGRAESHGHIVKRMLSSMDLEEPIVSFDDFRRCLRQAFAAKNSMGQVRGFSPEQAVLGKSKSLPGSLMADHEATSHSLLDSESPEGVKFREDLQRRERARRAFVSADNDSSIRRALLRRPRREPPEFKKGDWVLYWRKS